MLETQGIKETREAIRGVMHLGAQLVSAYKAAQADGKIDLGDVKIIADLLANEETRDLLAAAVDGIELVKHEVADLTVGEGVQLAAGVLEDALDEFNFARGIA